MRIGLKKIISGLGESSSDIFYDHKEFGDNGGGYEKSINALQDASGKAGHLLAVLKENPKILADVKKKIAEKASKDSHEGRTISAMFGV